MFGTARERNRSTQNAGSVGHVIDGVERFEYPRGVFQSEQIHYMRSEAVSGEMEWCFDEVHRYPYHDGGPLRLQRVGRDPGFIGVNINCLIFGGAYYEYNGRLYTDPPLFGGVMSNNSRPPSSFGDTSNRGPEAWNRFKPGKPSVDLGVFLAELKDMPRMLKDLRAKCEALRALRGKSSWKNFSLSQDFLSYQMAWKPFVKDILRSCKTAFEWRKRLDRLQKNSGVWQHVGGSLDSGEPVKTVLDYKAHTWGYVYPPINTWYFAEPHQVEDILSEQQKVWFSGRMKYYVPPVNTGADRLNVLRKMYGIALTPDLVWNIMPWSWMIDWFTNAGDVISNLSTGVVDDLVAAYAFVMGQTITEAQRNVTVHVGRDGAIAARTICGRSLVECKRRDVASPFGFGLDVGDLSSRQIAILAALGLRF